MLIQTHLQETNPVGSKAKHMISRVDALEEHFDSRPSDIAQQKHRGEVIRYAIFCPTVLDPETFLVCSRVSRDSCSLRTFKTIEIYSNFSKIYERLYLTTRFVCYPGVVVHVNNLDNRWDGEKWFTIKSVN